MLPPPAGASDFFCTSNYIESSLWIGVGLVFAVAAIKRSGFARRRCVFAATVFAAFGISDIIEARTGAWWRPWWLLAWKSLCVLAMLAMLVDHRRRRAADSQK